MTRRLTRRLTREEIDSWLFNNYRRFIYPEFMFSNDDNGDPAEKFTDERLKVLVVFLSAGKNKAMSNTFSALKYLCHEGVGDDVFVDVCYFPEVDNKNLLIDNDIPYMTGNSSHAPVWDYDVVFVSCAILPELYNLPQSYVHSGMPLTIDERDADDSIPMVFFGGAIAAEGMVATGPIYDDDGKYLGKSLVDIGNFGAGENTIPYICQRMLQFKRDGVVSKPQMKEQMISEGFLKEYLLYPEKYDYVYDDDRKIIIKEVRKLDERVPDRVLFSTIKDPKMPGFPLKVLTLYGNNCEHQDVMASWGCSGQGTVCTFCEEGTTAGHYVERPLEDIEKDLIFVRRTVAPNSASFFSYNLNYISHFMDLLALGAKYMSNLTLLNERLDVVANAPEQMDIAIKLGLKRVSGAIEGFGERLRNKIINKNLSRETLMKAVRIICQKKIMRFKFGLIITGKETDEDIEEFLDEMREMFRVRDSVGASTSFQLNVTPLVIYGHAALRWEPRIAAKDIFEQNKTMPKLVAGAVEMGVRVKFNTRSCSTWLEQVLIDFGPAGTDWLCDVAINGDITYTSTGFDDDDKAVAVGAFEKRGIDPLFFMVERGRDWIFPNDIIKVCDDKLLDMWWERFQRQDYSTPICLNTKASEGHNKCVDCGGCESVDTRVKMLTRGLEDEHTADDVLEIMSEHRHVDTVRIVLKQDSKWDMYNRTGLSHFVAAQFMQQDKRIEDGFYAVGVNSATWVSNNSQSGWYGGKWAFDLHMRERVPIEVFRNAIEGVNRNLKTCQVLAVWPDCKDIPCSRNAYISYIGETSSYTYSHLKEKFTNFDWTIKVPYKAMGYSLLFEPKSYPEIADYTLLVPKGGKVLTFMSLPAIVSPYVVWMTMLRRSYTRIVNEFHFNIIDTGLVSGATCDCGRPLMFSIFDNQVKRKCQVCEGKLLLARLTGRI